MKRENDNMNLRSGLGVLDNLHNIKQTSDGNERKV